jgi:hypothetical protein
MKKFFAFAVVILLFSLAAMLVLSVAQPDMQEGLKNFAQNTWGAMASFSKRLGEAFRTAFNG